MATRYLTKEFWDHQAEVSPKMMAEFREFCDKYKEENNWNTLFNAGYTDIEKSRLSQMSTVAPKIHDLPDAMQIGIFMAWQASKDPDPMINTDTEEGFPSYVDDVLKELEEQHG